MRNFFGWLFIIFALLSLLVGFTDPEVGAAAGFFNFLFWGVIGVWLRKWAKKKKDKETGKQKADEPAFRSIDEALGVDEIEEIPDNEVSPTQTVRFACKSCGAKNEVYSTGGSVRCEYCDTPSVPPIPNTKERSFDQVTYEKLDELLD